LECTKHCGWTSGPRGGSTLFDPSRTLFPQQIGRCLATGEGAIGSVVIITVAEGIFAAMGIVVVVSAVDGVKGAEEAKAEAGEVVEPGDVV
jgi:hypothetical protein